MSVDLGTLWQRDGWVWLSRFVPAATCDALLAAFEQEVRPCTAPLRRQLSSRPEPHDVDAHGLIRNPLVNPHQLLQCPGFARSEQRVFESCALVPIAQALLGGPIELRQSAFYESSYGCAAHIDADPADPGRPLIGAWVALADIPAGAGRFVLWEASHRPLEDPRLARVHALIHAQLGQRYVALAGDDPDRQAEIDALVAALSADHGWVRQAPALSQGDVLLWGERLLHGSERPVPGAGARSSLVLHFGRAGAAADPGRGAG